MATKEEIFERAKNGDMTLLSEPDLETYKNEFGDSPYHVLTNVVTPEFINDNHAFFLNLNKNIKNDNGDTPLHFLAYKRKIWIIGYVDSALRLQNNQGLTPLHILARLGVQEVITHPFSTTVYDNDGRTPNDYLDIYNQMILPE